MITLKKFMTDVNSLSPNTFEMEDFGNLEKAESHFGAITTENDGVFEDFVFAWKHEKAMGTHWENTDTLKKAVRLMINSRLRKIEKDKGNAASDNEEKTEQSDRNKLYKVTVQGGTFYARETTLPSGNIKTHYMDECKVVLSRVPMDLIQEIERELREMKVKLSVGKVSSLIASHLSDVQELALMGRCAGSNEKINFVKYLLFRHPDTDVIVDADQEWKEFDKFSKG
jgi:hypothetical protein